MGAVASIVLLFIILYPFHMNRFLTEAQRYNLLIIFSSIVSIIIPVGLRIAKIFNRRDLIIYGFSFILSVFIVFVPVRDYIKQQVRVCMGIDEFYRKN